MFDYRCRLHYSDPIKRGFGFMSLVRQTKDTLQDSERETLSRLRVDIQKGLDSGVPEPWDAEEIKQAARVERIKARAA
jgi:Arc/MetJ-type ribon-helix-helix transcriptional regulator